MYHSISFLDYYDGVYDLIGNTKEPFYDDDAVNTWDDWHLIPSTRPVINPPQVQTQYVSIPGINGELDLTESLTGSPTYKNRTGSLEFIVANGYEPWDVKYSTIMSYLHGKRKLMVLEDDRNYIYDGRFVVNNWKSDKTYSLITLDYNLYPYKKYIQSSLHASNWLWDPFDFVNGYIDPTYRKEYQLNPNEDLIVILNPGDSVLRPSVYCSEFSSTPYDGNLIKFQSINGDGSLGKYSGYFKGGNYYTYHDFVLEKGGTTYKFTNLRNNSVSLVLNYRREVL